MFPTSTDGNTNTNTNTNANMTTKKCKHKKMQTQVQIQLRKGVRSVPTLLTCTNWLFSTSTDGYKNTNANYKRKCKHKKMQTQMHILIVFNSTRVLLTFAESNSTDTDPTSMLKLIGCIIG